FRLHDGLSARYEVASAATADELLDGAAFCVFGGGSLLSGHKDSTGPYAASKQQEYEELIEAIERRRVPLHFFSIGGDGSFGDGSGIAPYRERLLRSPQCKSATIRQEPDVALIEGRYGIPAVFYPDVLLDVGAFWEIERNRSEDGKLHVGLNLPRSFRRTVALLNAARRLRPDIVYHFIRTVRPNAPFNEVNELAPPAEDEHIRLHEYDDPVDTLRLLSELDVIFSFKLHIGLTASALGVPFVCVTRTLKSKAFLHSIGADFAYWGEMPKGRVQWEMLRTALSPARIRELSARFARDTDISQQIRQSRGHLEEVEKTARLYTAA
ncbi:MAG TPA: hypothetical protein VF190_08780, partial [Rhodothermales bacterium]